MVMTLLGEDNTIREVGGGGSRNSVDVGGGGNVVVARTALLINHPHLTRRALNH